MPLDFFCFLPHKAGIALYRATYLATSSLSVPHFVGPLIVLGKKKKNTSYTQGSFLFFDRYLMYSNVQINLRIPLRFIVCACINLTMRVIHCN